MLLPASFVLHLNTDLPLEVSKYEEIKRITGIPFIDTKQVKTAPLLQLITKSTSDESLDSSNNRGLFVVSRGCPIKKFTNVLLHTAKMFDPRVKSQARDQNNRSRALK